MPESLRDSPDDLAFLVAETATGFNLPAEFVEKDFWITETLRCLSNIFGAQEAPFTNSSFVFKGGTSLSKAYKLIQRFSEDVDVLLVPPLDMPRGAIDRLIISTLDAVGAALRLADATDGPYPKRGIKRDRRFRYPQRTGNDTVSSQGISMPFNAPFNNSSTSDGLLVEVGRMGGPEPRETKQITSLLAEWVPQSTTGVRLGDWNEFEPVEVSVLCAERTLIEKVSLLHSCGEQLEDEDVKGLLGKSARHFYDIHALLSNSEIRERVAACDVPDLSRQIDERSTVAKRAFSPRPDGGYATSDIFQLGGRLYGQASSAYADALGLVYGPATPFDECLEVIQTYKHLL